eukprot:scaffold111133_cov16-Tisochrysis_lutea.AAC.2
MASLHGMAELPDRMSRIGEGVLKWSFAYLFFFSFHQHYRDIPSSKRHAVGGVISHIGKNAVSIVMDFPKNVSKGSADPFDPLSRSTHARALNSYDMIDIKPGGQFSDLRRDRIVAGLEDPDPARRRDTLKDKADGPAFWFILLSVKSSACKFSQQGTDQTCITE